MQTSTPNVRPQQLSSTTGSKWAFTALLTNHRRHLPVHTESTLCFFTSNEVNTVFSFFSNEANTVLFLFTIDAIPIPIKVYFDLFFFQSKSIPITKYIEV